MFRQSSNWKLDRRTIFELRSASKLSFISEAPISVVRDGIQNETLINDKLLVKVGIVGVPNAGKSTLTNALVGRKVTAVSSKTNTTARSVIAPTVFDGTRILFYDTPGIVAQEFYRDKQHKNRIESAWKTALSADVLMFVVDAHRQLLKPDPRVLKQIVNLNFIKEQFDEGKNNATLSLVLNKVDSLAKDELKGMLLLTDELRRLANFKEIFYVSALRRKGIDDLRAWLLSNAKPCNLPVPESDDSGLDRGNIAREILREKIFRAYYKEIPYITDIELVSFKNLIDGSILLDFNLLIPSESIKRIVVGNQGAAIRSVGTAARIELQKAWNTAVHLYINVKVQSHVK